MAEDLKPRADFDAGHVPMGEEMDSMKRTLPSLLPVLIAFLVVGTILVIYILTSRKPPACTANVSKVVLFPVHAQSAGQGAYGITELDVDKESLDMVVLLAQIQIRNNDTKGSFYIKSIAAVISGDAGESEDIAASGRDYDTLFEAYPSLAAYRLPPIAPELEVKPGQQVSGSEIFGFQIPYKVFQKSKTLNITIALYDRSVISLPIQLTQIQVLASATPETGHKHKK